MSSADRTAPVVALVRRPATNLADGLTTLTGHDPVDRDIAYEQWQVHCDTLERNGWIVQEVPGGQHLADSVFIEDTAVVFGQTALICRPGADSRRAEVPIVRHTLRSLGYDVHEVAQPATIDGGDVMKIGDTIWIGRGRRTNDAGIEAARQAFEPVGATVKAVPNDLVLHLKSAVTALPDGTVIGWEPVVQHPELFEDFVPMPEEAGAHVVDLGGGRLLMSAAAPQSSARLASMGWEPVPVDISEFEKLEGCVTCLSIRLRDLPGKW